MCLIDFWWTFQKQTWVSLNLWQISSSLVFQCCGYLSGSYPLFRYIVRIRNTKNHKPNQNLLYTPLNVVRSAYSRRSYLHFDELQLPYSSIFCWNFAHVSYLTMRAKGCGGFVLFGLDLELITKIKKTWFLHTGFLYFY